MSVSPAGAGVQNDGRLRWLLRRGMKELDVLFERYYAQRFVAAPRADDVPAVVPIVLTAVIGLALSAVWEMVEWFGRTFITAQIYVTYDDTIGDMAVGGFGAIVAGVVLASVRLVREDAGDGARSTATLRH